MSFSDTMISVAALELEHLNTLKQAVTKLLSTNLAVQTYAQVVDGQPIKEIWDEYRNGKLRFDLDRNLEPSHEALRIIESFRLKWEIETFNVDAKVAQAYQNASIGTRDFHLRLLELVVSISHDIAAILFKEAEGGIQKPDVNHRDEIQYPFERNKKKLVRYPPEPTLLYHWSYTDYEDYPRGVADMPGYWTEWAIFGGVILFERGPSGLGCDNAFVHPLGHFIFRISDAQIQQLMDFFLKEESTNFPVPIRAERYAPRIDPYDAMSMNIYRNKYERRIPATRPIRCVRHSDDYPELLDMYEDWERRRKEGRG